MKNQTCCFTGHRHIPENEHAVIQKRLETTIENLIRQGICCFSAGGAIGFDTMAARVVLRLKTKHPHIRLILVLPCKEQTNGWDETDIKIYNRILKQADKVVYISERYDENCMRKRNRHPVDHSRFCVCYLTDLPGGAAYTVSYAKQKGLRIINIAAD